jgi:hypothetical protein
MFKLPQQQEPTKTTTSKSQKGLSTTATTIAVDEQTSTNVPTGVLLSERTDIWNAVDSINSMKTRGKVKGGGASMTGSGGGGVKRKLDQKIAKMEAADADSDDFLANLMKDRTGDAFDDLVAQVEEQQALLKAQKQQPKKLVKKSVSIAKATTTNEAATTNTTTTTSATKKTANKTKSTPMVDEPKSILKTTEVPVTKSKTITPTPTPTTHSTTM